MRKEKEWLTKSEVEGRLEKAHSLLEVGRIINKETDLNRLLQVIMTQTTLLMEGDRSSLFLWDRERGELWSRLAQGMESREIRFPADKGITGHVVTTGETVNIPDAYQDPRFNREVDKKTGYCTRSILTMAMKNKREEVIGAFQCLNKEGGPFSMEDEKVLDALASQTAIAIENAQPYEEQKRQFKSIIEVLASSIDARDPYTAGHSQRVMKYTVGTAEEMDFPNTSPRT